MSDNTAQPKLKQRIRDAVIGFLQRRLDRKAVTA